ncbi:insecticial toxin [Escherichia coli TA280]|nr:insecticial toxin [Escherichia coli TA280]
MQNKNKIYLDIKLQVASSFVWGGHMTAIETASRKGRFAVSFRSAGKYTLAAIAKGAAAKGHDILEKTIKPSSIERVYGQKAKEKWNMLKQAGLTGYVGHWECNELKGIYMSSRHSLDNSVHSHIYPIDMRNQDALNKSINSLRLSNNWEAQLFTGDYDAHDMITFRGAGRPRSVLVNSVEEKMIIDSINLEISKIDSCRPFNSLEYNVVRHGPQVNFSSFMLAHEPQKVIDNNGFPGDVARPGAFPIAMCDRGIWSIIYNLDDLTEFYNSIGARIKETWIKNGERVFQDTSNGMVKLGRRGSRTT